MSVIHIIMESDGCTEVWIDELRIGDGKCIGVGPSRDEAVANAAEDLESALDVLQREAAR